MNLDHITFACESLEQAQLYAQSEFGVCLPPGGEHAAMGTHNLLTRIASNTFLEFIAINPDAPAPNRPRWFNLDAFAASGALDDQPQLIGWVASVNDIASALTRLAFASGRSVPISRGNLHWHISIPDDGSLPADGVAPTLIQWPEAISPVARMEAVGIELVGLQIIHPRAGHWHTAAQSFGWREDALDNARLDWISADQADLRLTLNTPRGTVILCKGL
jgi:Glyoxalase-like domain